MQPSPDTQTVATPTDERLAYVPPKLERLDAAETQLNLVIPSGDDGVFYS